MEKKTKRKENNQESKHGWGTGLFTMREYSRTVSSKAGRKTTTPPLSSGRLPRNVHASFTAPFDTRNDPRQDMPPTKMRLDARHRANMTAGRPSMRDHREVVAFIFFFVHTQWKMGLFRRMCRSARRHGPQVLIISTYPS